MSFRTFNKCERFNAFCTSALERKMEAYNFDQKNLTSYGDKFYFFLLITLTYWVKSLSSLFKIILRVNEFDLLLNLELEKNISVEENWWKFKKKLVKYDNI